MSHGWTENYESLLREHLRFLDAGAPLLPDTPMVDLGLDSMGTIQLLIDIEDAFDISVPDELLIAESIATPASLWRLVSALRLGARP